MSPPVKWSTSKGRGAAGHGGLSCCLVLAILESDWTILAVVAGIPAVVVSIGVLWTRPNSPRPVLAAAGVVGVALIALAVWSVVRPAAQPVLAEPPIVSTVAPPPAGGPTSSACSPSGTTVQVGAQNLVFDTKCLAAPADTAFTIEFDNKDAGVQHSVHIFADDPLSDPDAASLFQGELVAGPTTVTYHVGALAAGTYFFHCDVHVTTMRGTFVVGG
jgi:plastocyanin